ncbi:Circadian locomoter output cycles protein kaput [Trichinella britovi]|uniref:Circadian locomoter output cycles protein kaput n=1 Tax=Trichinella britovi TaxID=45882 RepID=A0A0V1CYK2_TRIBR|nr:Circadian locomoter output cycles protein kaput [Trichinella britovi]
MAHEISESKRQSRNLSEKRRRDTFNTIITELASIVCSDGRKLDKSNVLRQTIAYLQKQNCILDLILFICTYSGLVQFSSSESTSGTSGGYNRSTTSLNECFLMLQKSVSMFLMITSETGQVLYASDSPLRSLRKFNHKQGYQEGITLIDIVDQMSVVSFKSFMKERLTSANVTEKILSFYWNFIDDTEAWVRCKVSGLVVRKSAFPEFEENCEGEYLYCCVCMPLFHDVSIPLPQLKSVCEFACKFNTEWKFLCIDENGIKITGYTPFEIVGCSGYDYYHADDLEQISADHETLMHTKEVLMKPYRFQIKCGSWIYIESRCTVLPSNSSVLCVSLVVSKESEDCKSAVSVRNASSSSSSSKATVSDNSVDNSCSRLAVPQVLRPQPGVSIEHSPLLDDRCCTASAASAAAAAAAAAFADFGFRKADPQPNYADDCGLVELNADEERLLCEQLMHRQSSLQEQITQYQTELQLLQTRLYMSLGATTTPNSRNLPGAGAVPHLISTHGAAAIAAFHQPQPPAAAPDWAHFRAHHHHS